MGLKFCSMILFMALVLWVADENSRLVIRIVRPEEWLLKDGAALREERGGGLLS